MALRLKSKGESQVGNAILYGGENKIYGIPMGEITEQEVFFVETDFGNHMTLTWAEVTQMFEIVAWADYDEWKQAREQLRQEPNLIERQLPYDGSHWSE